MSAGALPRRVSPPPLNPRSPGLVAKRDRESLPYRCLLRRSFFGSGYSSRSIGVLVSCIELVVDRLIDEPLALAEGRDDRRILVEHSGHQQSLARVDLLAKCQSPRSGSGVHRAVLNR